MSPLIMKRLSLWAGLCLCHALALGISAQFPPLNGVSFWLLIYIASAMPGLLFGWTGLPVYVVKTAGILPYIQPTELGWVLAAVVWAGLYGGFTLIATSASFARIAGTQGKGA
ncbi:MAG: hypothetical protein B7Z81_16130 [Acidocella sp. 20-61-6]|nr:MAG: hypothetical protein B7Z81_16130 [Acidocella sp. 20-61-6]